jgi:hypothetical protein
MAGGGVDHLTGIDGGGGARHQLVDQRRKTTRTWAGPLCVARRRRIREKKRPETAQAEERERKKIFLYFFPGNF